MGEWGWMVWDGGETPKLQRLAAVFPMENHLGMENQVAQFPLPLEGTCGLPPNA